MTGQILEFTANGSARALSGAIEEYAQEKRVVTAVVVPWESDETTLSMAVTSVKSDGWAIEHTNLGTIRLTDLGGERTHIAIIAHEHDNPEKEKLAGLLGGFAKQIQDRFQALGEGEARG